MTATRPHLTQKGLEVLNHHPMQDRVLGRSRLIPEPREVFSNIGSRRTHRGRAMNPHPVPVGLSDHSNGFGRSVPVIGGGPPPLRRRSANIRARLGFAIATVTVNGRRGDDYGAGDLRRPGATPYLIFRADSYFMTCTT
jgi:hypothetical protein